MLKKGYLILDQPANIEEHILEFYTELFDTENNCTDNGLIDQVISPSISLDDNIMLTHLPSIDEVRNVVFSMNANGASSPYGFGGFFYQKYWDMIGEDVFNAVLQFFKQGWLLPNLNSNLVVLISKFQGVDRIEHFMPIALTNFQFKIITKVIVDRLSSIAPKIISEQQRGFIKGRQIKDCICIASEAINMLDKKVFGGNLALKIDIKKAFNTIECNFLFKVLDSYGFDPMFYNWVKVILHSARLSFSVNGHSIGFFPCKRGVTQGDPLPLSCFAWQKMFSTEEFLCWLIGASYYQWLVLGVLKLQVLLFMQMI